LYNISEKLQKRKREKVIKQMKKNKTIQKIITLAILLISVNTSSIAKTYDIVENDALEEMQEKGKKALPKIKKEIEKEKKELLNFKGTLLRPATKNYTYYIDPTYTLEEDMMYYDEKEKKWKILYPKGYKINPIQYIPYKPPPLVVFNYCNKDELNYVKNLIKNNPLNYILINSGCPLKDIKDTNLKIYFLTDDIKQKFKLKETISIVDVDMQKKLIKVSVISTKNKNTNQKNLK
jgi:conjugal transfer pilus assembly protein TraW